MVLILGVLSLLHLQDIWKLLRQSYLVFQPEQATSTDTVISKSHEEDKDSQNFMRDCHIKN